MRSIMTLCAALALAACNSEAPDAPAGKGMAKPDLSKVAAVDGVRPDAGVIRDRSVQGTWRGRIADAQAELSLGAGGQASVRVTRGGSVSDVASGTWRWRDDGTIEGDLSGGRAELANLSSWKGSFPAPATIEMKGASGTTATFSRGASVGYATAEEAAKAGQRAMAAKAGETAR